MINHENAEVLLKYETCDDFKICPRCEMENKSEYEFCQLCGSRLFEIIEERDVCDIPEEEKPFGIFMKIFLFIAIAAFLLICARGCIGY